MAHSAQITHGVALELLSDGFVAKNLHNRWKESPREMVSSASPATLFPLMKNISVRMEQGLVSYLLE